MKNENQSLPVRQSTDFETAANNSVDQYTANQCGAGNDIAAKKGCVSVWLPETASLHSAAPRNGAPETPLVLGEIDSTTRVLFQLLEAVTSGDADACTMAFRALDRLPVLQRVTLATVSLMSLHEEDAAYAVETTLRTAGLPLSDLVAPMAAARFWAERASRNELKAYAAASFEALNPNDQAAFLQHYGRGAEA